MSGNSAATLSGETNPVETVIVWFVEQ